MRTFPVFALLLGLFVLSSAAVAKEAVKKEKLEPPKPHTDEQVADAFKRFDSTYSSQDMDRRLNILRWIGMYRHPEVLKRITKILMKEKNTELQAAAAEGFGHQTSHAKKAHKTVKDALLKFKKYGSRLDPETPELLARNNEEAAVLVNLIKSMTLLQPYDPRRHKNDGWKELKKFIDHHSDDVAVAMFEYIGKTEEYRALPLILEWYNYYPDGYSWAGVSAKVDTGTPGTKDQKAAKAKALGKAAARRKKVRPAAWEAMSKAVKELTGEEMKKPAELKAWMKKEKAFLKKMGV